MVLPKTTVVFPLCAILFGCGIVGVSLVRASDTFAIASSESSTPSIISHFQDRIVAGHPLYPFRVVLNKAEIALASAEHRDVRKLHIATERLIDAQTLVTRGQLGRAVETLVKGQSYATSCFEEIDTWDAAQKEHMRSVLDQYQDFIKTRKDIFSDEQKALLDRSFIENEMFRQRL